MHYAVSCWIRGPPWFTLNRVKGVTGELDWGFQGSGQGVKASTSASAHGVLVARPGAIEANKSIELRPPQFLTIYYVQVGTS